MFVGREKELSTLRKQYGSGKFEFTVIYGRRRVGKTAIINEFIRDKDAIYFTGVETSAKQNLENLSKSILSFETGIEADSVFASFQAALEHVFAMAETRRLILVIDEYPYVARASKSLASTLQLLIDRHKDSSQLFLILCGSSISYMEDHVLAYKAPLFGRRTAQMKVLPFEFAEACRYFNGLPLEEKAVAYGVVGGTPQYLLQLDDKKSIAENIKQLYLDPASPLFEEPSNLLKQEVREPAIYNAIVTAIASGATKLSEISTRVGEETGVCATYIRNLITLGIVKKDIPFGTKTTRKTIYTIEDNMFRFWYRFVVQNNSIISRGAVEQAYRRIEPHISEYMGPVFEEICKQHLWQQLLADTCPVQFTDLGRWWGADARTKKQEEIDIMGTDGKDAAIFGECKWTNERVGSSVLDTLVYQSNIFEQNKKWYFLFAKSGFTEGCEEKARVMGNVSLVSFADILQSIEG